jgi:hypothetical protein
MAPWGQRCCRAFAVANTQKSDPTIVLQVAVTKACVIGGSAKITTIG